ncbi:hypothetical protein JCM19294_504 [Nonlabens tegetincola]|uniref:Putative auto-transporter adhesin head GIN domain-containing protein n=1 Tax=Nonlabens tegetincola TaxID=323273 RepID=A0A090Q5K5_9FLAO|nr:head GIN domain-containing protein [Nonlabens tegetincola]GAK96998.1 hypothetical protein JCM19294_504 [Nonlabens tegetincola]
MKKAFFFLFVVILFSCDSENVNDCVQTSGDLVQIDYDITGFNKIIVYDRSQLIVSQGPYEVILETGENLVNDIDITVADATLSIKNNNSCNLVREYGVTKVYVTLPDLQVLRNSSGLAVKSSGTLNFNELTLLCEDTEEEDAFHISGDFDLDINVDKLSIETNGLSNFFLNGTVNELDLKFLLGDSRFEGRNLEVQTAKVFHRGTNDIFLQAKQQVTGSLLSTGNLILTEEPPVLNVEELYTGRVIIE